MSRKFDDLVDRVVQRVFATHDGSQPVTEEEHARWRAIMKFTLEEVELFVDPKGDIYSPAPPPRIDPMEGRNARWGGGRRRR